MIIKRFFLFFSLLLGLHLSSSAQSPYYPPFDGKYWETSVPSTHNFCNNKIHELLDFLEQDEVKAFILLIDGKIVIEKYFGTFNKDSSNSWGEASQSLVTFLIGIAESEELLSINEEINPYLEDDWSLGTSEQENSIKLIHLMNMTSGFSKTSMNEECTDRDCLNFRAAAGEEWLYHKSSLPLTIEVFEKAIDQSMNKFLFNHLRANIGLTGSFKKNGQKIRFMSNARSMAKFGLLLLNKGKWNDKELLNNANFYQLMTNSSQPYNPSFGLFSWLNNENGYLSPSTLKMNKELVNPAAPEDLYTFLGENGNAINIAPSQNMVWIKLAKRTGNKTIEDELQINNRIWEQIAELKCRPSQAKKSKESSNNDFLKFSSAVPIKRIMVTDESGKIRYAAEINSSELNIPLVDLDKGSYFAKILFVNNVISTKRFTVQ